MKQVDIKPDSFWRRVDMSAGPLGCWPWMGRRNQYGYGVVQFAGRRSTCSRVSWLLTNGVLPDRTQVDHLCRNRICVNPAHLEPVTQQENQRRGLLARGRTPLGITYASGDHEHDIRSRAKGGRYCRICHTIYNRTWRAKRRGQVAA
jgi:hypothetical protein